MLGNITGNTLTESEGQMQKKLMEEKGLSRKEARDLVVEARDLNARDFLSSVMVGGGGLFDLYGDYKESQQGKAKLNETLKLNDFTIRANPKDTLVMAGGTKFGDETNTLLKSMLGELKKSSVLNIDSNGVMQKFVETNYK